MAVQVNVGIVLGDEPVGAVNVGAAAPLMVKLRAALQPAELPALLKAWTQAW